MVARASDPAPLQKKKKKQTNERDPPPKPKLWSVALACAFVYFVSSHVGVGKVRQCKATQTRCLRRLGDASVSSGPRGGAEMSMLGSVPLAVSGVSI